MAQNEISAGRKREQSEEPTEQIENGDQQKERVPKPQQQKHLKVRESEKTEGGENYFVKRVSITCWGHPPPPLSKMDN